MLKAVLLDIDGTLVDSNAMHAHTWSSASAEYGYERPAAFFRPLIGMGGDRVLARIDPALTEDGEPGKSIAAKRGEFFRADHLPTLQPTNGAKALVERLHALGLRCVVASSTNGSDLDDLLDVAGVRGRIHVRTTADDANESKPAPDIVSSALHRAGVAPSEAIMIGDTPYDVEAAHGAGVAIIGMRCGGWGDADLAGAIEIYDDPADLLAQFEGSAITRMYREPPDSTRRIIAYHVAAPDAFEAIERDGFRDEAGTYKATGMDLNGVFLSTRVLDSDDDRPETLVFAVEADEMQIAPYEILEASADHRNYCVPAAIVNRFPRRRLTPNEARRVPVNDRASDPAYPHE